MELSQKFERLNSDDQLNTLDFFHIKLFDYKLHSQYHSNIARKYINGEHGKGNK